MSNINNYLDILTKEHSNFLNDIINTYFTKYYNQQFFTYFRIFFFYYLITTYIYKPELNINEIKKVFLLWLTQTLDNHNKKNIIKNFEYHFNYLFKVFFIDKNIYFHVYFNNLIKYFLPLPFELNVYSPLIVFRDNVNSFYKKNNVDYLDKINKFDLQKIKVKHLHNELDIHIPIKYFNKNIFKNLDVIYLIGKKNKLYICDSNNNILYSRLNNFNEKEEDNIKNFNDGVVFEKLFPLWEKETGTINFEDAFYLCIMKKINTNDLFKVFSPYNLNNNNYKYLFHNKLFVEGDNDYNVVLNRETFFYIIPTSKSKYFKYEGKRNCLIFKINKDINNLLDLTSTIVTNNNFTKNLIKKDKNNKVWISYDPLDSLNYYKNKKISTKFDDNFKCLTIQNSSIKNRYYCDAYDYSGRRKLQEILFKTRKYIYKKIYFTENNDNLDDYVQFKLYHPENKPVNITVDFDKFILNQLNINGFFSVDYGDAIDGGEILLTRPNKYLEFFNKLENTCYDK